MRDQSCAFISRELASIQHRSSFGIIIWLCSGSLAVDLVVSHFDHSSELIYIVISVSNRMFFITSRADFARVGRRETRSHGGAHVESSSRKLVLHVATTDSREIAHRICTDAMSEAPFMLFAILFPLIGCACAIRMSDVLIERQLFLKSELTKIGTAYFLTVIALVIALPRARLSLWGAVFIPFALLVIYVLGAISKRSQHFRDSLSESLSLVSLKMKSGRSFRQSLSEVTAESEPRLRAKLSEITGRVVFSQQNSAEDVHRPRDVFIASVIEELTLIDRQPHAASRRLAVFREKIRIENDFRRRSGQILSRIRAQSLVMSVLYIALAAFVAVKFGWSRNVHLFIWSAVLFATGALWIWLGGKNLKWKV